jgi:hypothetical protein
MESKKKIIKLSTSIAIHRGVVLISLKHFFFVAVRTDAHAHRDSCLFTSMGCLSTVLWKRIGVASQLLLSQIYFTWPAGESRQRAITARAFFAITSKHYYLALLPGSSVPVRKSSSFQTQF